MFRPLKKNVFDVHEPKGINRLDQLRVGLSPHREHKKRHNFLDTTVEMDAETNIN